MSGRDASGAASAIETGLRLLGRRPLTERELRRGLEQRGHAPDVVEAACARLVEMGYLDDRKLAFEFIVTRAERLGHAPGKLVEDLCARGVARAVARAALAEAVERGDVSELALLRRRLRRQLEGAERPQDRRAYRRVYNALRRAGFTDELIRQEIDPDLPDAPTSDEAIDDFP